MFLYLSLSFFGQVLSSHRSDQMSQRSQGSRVALYYRVCIVVKILIVSGAHGTDQWTMSPIKLLWTAQNTSGDSWVMPYVITDIVFLTPGTESVKMINSGEFPFCKILKVSCSSSICHFSFSLCHCRTLVFGEKDHFSRESHDCTDN